MTNDNTLRRPSTGETTRTRIHLVHSCSGQRDRRTVPAARPQLVPQIASQGLPPAERQIIPQVRSSRSIDTLTLAAGAFTAPFIWLGHAFQRLMHAL